MVAAGFRFRDQERFGLNRFRVQGAGCRVQGSGCRVQGSGFRVHGAGFGVQGSGYRVQSSGFRIQGTGLRLQGSGFGIQGPELLVQGRGSGRFHDPPSRSAVQSLLCNTNRGSDRKNELPEGLGSASGESVAAGERVWHI